MAQYGNLCIVYQSIDLDQFLLNRECPPKAKLGPFQEVLRKTYCASAD